MTQDTVRSETPAPAPDSTAAAPKPPTHSRMQALGRALSPRRISAVYVLIGLIVLFSIWVPDTFLTVTNLKTILVQQAITGILAVGIVISLSSGSLDLSAGASLGVASVIAAWLLGLKGESILFAVVATLLAGLVIGIANGLLVAYFRIDSFIATLGVSSVLAGVTTWVSGGENITGLPSGFEKIATNEIFGLQMPFWYLLVLAVVVWFVLEQTPAGRYVYATGGGSEAARLAGVPTAVVMFAALAVGGLIAGFAGLLATASLGAGSPVVGPPYLLPALSAVFLGSTQFKGGRVNVAGTVLAVYVLATGVKGLQLAGAPIWIPEVFNGLALLLSVGIAVKERSRMVRFRRFSRRRRPASPQGAQVSP
jgi:ribose transport system permease protein